MVKIIWSDRALKDLESIAGYIAKDSPKYAKITLEKILDKVTILEQFPDSGRMVPEINDPRIKEIIVGSYRVIYERAGKKVSILTVHHSAKKIFHPGK